MYSFAPADQQEEFEATDLGEGRSLGHTPMAEVDTWNRGTREAIPVQASVGLVEANDVRLLFKAGFCAI